MLGKNVNGFFSAARLFDGEAAGGQRSAKHFAQGWLIIDYQHVKWTRGHSHPLGKAFSGRTKPT